MLKQNTLERDQGENETQDLKQTSIHKKERQTARRHPQEREVITPASLNGQLARVLRAHQLHMALKNNDTFRRGERGLVFQNIVPHPLIANDSRCGQRQSNAMATSHARRRPNISTATTSPHTPKSRKGEDHSNWGRLSDSSKRSRPPTRARSAPPIRRATLILSKKEDSLLEAPQRVSSDEEPPMEMTSCPIIGYSIEPPESLSPMPIAKSNKNEDIVEDGSTLKN